ncbi:hypothetical protein REPUB_Repub08aG0093900 [Reevesia pubescens]
MLGTPDEESWPGVSSLPGFPGWGVKYTPKDLATEIPQLDALYVDLLKGVRGAYSEAAVEKAYPNCEAVPCAQFDATFEKISLIIEFDSKLVVSWISNKLLRPWKDWCIFADIDYWSETIGDVQFSHVSRKANSFVDSLAKMGEDHSKLFTAWL